MSSVCVPMFRLGVRRGHGLSLSAKHMLTSVRLVGSGDTCCCRCSWLRELPRKDGSTELLTLLNPSRIFQSHFHSSTAAETERRVKCTMIPGDGVGPEMMDSVQDVLKAIGAPIDFEVHHLSEAGTLQSEFAFCSIPTRIRTY